MEPFQTVNHACMSHVLHRASINCGNKIECKVIRVDVDVCTKTFN